MKEARALKAKRHLGIHLRKIHIIAVKIESPFKSQQVNNNALSSVESRLLGDKFCCQRCWCCYTTFSYGIQMSVICHNVNTQKVKIARRDRPHNLASNRCETFENLLHIDIAPLRSTLSGILHSKN